MNKNLKFLNSEQKGAILKALILNKIKKEDLNNNSILNLFKYEPPITFSLDEWSNTPTFSINGVITDEKSFFELKNLADNIFNPEEVLFLHMPGGR